MLSGRACIEAKISVREKVTFTEGRFEKIQWYSLPMSSFGRHVHILLPRDWGSYNGRN